MSTNVQVATVGQVMRQPTRIESDAHLAAAAYVIEHRHAPALVVVGDTYEPVAVITSAEITRPVAHGRSLENTRVNQVVTAELVTVPADATAEDAAQLMLSLNVHNLPVVEDHRLVGMVDLRNLCRMSLPTPE